MYKAAFEGTTHLWIQVGKGRRSRWRLHNTIVDVGEKPPFDAIEIDPLHRFVASQHASKRVNALHQQVKEHHGQAVVVVLDCAVDGFEVDALKLRRCKLGLAHKAAMQIVRRLADLKRVGIHQRHQRLGVDKDVAFVEIADYVPLGVDLFDRQGKVARGAVEEVAPVKGRQKTSAQCGVVVAKDRSALVDFGHQEADKIFPSVVISPIEQICGPGDRGMCPGLARRVGEHGLQLGLPLCSRLVIEFGNQMGVAPDRPNLGLAAAVDLFGQRYLLTPLGL